MREIEPDRYEVAAHPAHHRPFRAQRLWISRRRLRSLYGAVRRAS